MAIDQERLRTAVIGCGTIGTQRAAETSLHSRTRLLLCIDTSHGPARNTAERYGSAWSTDWRIAVDDERIDVIVICTPAAIAYDIAAAALERGKHVLVEQPMGHDLAHAEALAAIANRSAGRFKVGFNHRYHPAVSRARELLELGEIGEVAAVRVCYDDGRVGAADLVAWFAGVPARALASVEENAFARLRCESAVVASEPGPSEESKKIFLLEVAGSRGTLAVAGLGGVYGTERLTVSLQNQQTAGAVAQCEAFEGPDRSWAIEWHQFVDAIEQASPYWGTAGDGIAAMRIVNALYRSSRDGGATPL